MFQRFGAIETRSAEFGLRRHRLPRRALERYRQGRGLEATAPVDIFVNRKLIAKGEVVVVEDRFGIKVTEIFSK